MKTIKFIAAAFLAISSVVAFSQNVDVNAEKSKIKWEGKKIGGAHEGYINLKSGNLEMKNGDIVAGNFVVNMSSISCTDLKDEAYNQKLVGHLKSDDFFSVEKFPEAKFVITSTKVKNGKGTITGDITIKGKTESITFPVEKTGNDYSAKIEIDRSKFDVRYGSKSFFSGLGDNVIDDIFTLKVLLVLDMNTTTMR
jgi:polyisoprenoid-binding protein YceI